MMLTSGSAGRANLRAALEKYESLFAERFGFIAGKILVESTRGMDAVKRLWELERILTIKNPKRAS